MTSHIVRLYTLAAALLVFFVAWAGIAARPWRSEPTATDRRVAALAVREARLRRDSVLVRRVVERRWATYRTQLAARKAERASARRAQAAAAAQAATPSVRVVTLPPLTVTRSS